MAVRRLHVAEKHSAVWLVDLRVVGEVARGRARKIFGPEAGLHKRAMRGRAENERKGSHVLSEVGVV